MYRDTYTLETHRQNHDVRSSITYCVAEQLYCAVNKQSLVHKHQVHKIHARQLNSRSRLRSKRRCDFYCAKFGRFFCGVLLFRGSGVATSKAMFAADISKAIADMAAASTHLAERALRFVFCSE